MEEVELGRDLGDTSGSEAAIEQRELVQKLRQNLRNLQQEARTASGPEEKERLGVLAMALMGMLRQL